MNPNRLPVYVIAGLWVFIVSINILFYPFLPAQPSFSTILLCIGAVALILLPSILKPATGASEPELFRKFSEWISERENVISLLFILPMIGGTLIDYSLSGVQASDAGMADVREFHIGGGVEFSPLRYLTLFLKSAGLLAIAHVVVSRAPWSVLMVALLAGAVAGVIETVSYGGRSFIRMILSLAAAGVLVGSSAWLIKNRARVLVGGATAFVLLLITSVWFNKLRNSNINTYLLTMRDGQVFLDSVGFGNVPMDVAYGAGLVVGYLVVPIGFFDHFIKVNTLAPTLGAFLFPTISARFGFDWPTTKEYVDGYYGDFGIDWNIWATSFRELMIDTGIWGFLPVCAALGFFLRWLNGSAARNKGAALLRVICFAWLLNSPFESIMKVRYFEFACFLAVVMTMATFIYQKMSNRKVRANPAEAPAVEQPAPLMPT